MSSWLATMWATFDREAADLAAYRADPAGWAAVAVVKPYLARHWEAPAHWAGYDPSSPAFDWEDDTLPAPWSAPRKCECGLGPDGGVHSDWCPLRGQASAGRHAKTPR